MVATFNRIKSAALDESSSQVMDLASWLTDVHGARLTGSPVLQQAAEWAVSRMAAWGITASLEPWPPSAAGSAPNNGFPRGWVNEKFYMAVTAPEPFAIPGAPTAWTPGTRGLVRGEVVLVTEREEGELHAKYAGRLKGKWIMTAAAPAVAPYFTPPAQRYSDADLERMETRGRATGAGAGATGGTPAGRRGAPSAALTATTQDGASTASRQPVRPVFSRTEFFRSEGALGLLLTAPRSGHGIFTVDGANRLAAPQSLLRSVNISAETYGRLSRLLAKRIPVIIEADIRNRDIPNPRLFNVIAEIRGTDRADEVVMLGAHLDAWHAATGATDNGAGVAVLMEAMRVLKTLGLPLRRTVRLALWTGEEQGLIGSTLYVREHFGGAPPERGRPPVPRTPDHARLAAYFNLDNGTGAIRGVYLQQNEVVAPIFRAWMEPLHDLGMRALTLGNSVGTDHVAFDNAGLPAWDFVQDQIEYNAISHHTNLDTYERLIPRDLRQNAAIAAAFAYAAANRAEPLPRKAQAER